MREFIVTSIALVALAVPAFAAGARVGAPAPLFRLPTLPGKLVSSGALRGRRLVIVVGRSQKSAPHCRKWMEPLVKRYPPGKSPVQVYQVVVIDKSWYVPRSLVLGKLEKFVGKSHRDRFLIEWYTVFADSFGIRRHDDPTILLIDAGGILRLRQRMRYDDTRWQALRRRIDGLGR